jgi:hypothetical protein
MAAAMTHEQIFLAIIPRRSVKESMSAPGCAHARGKYAPEWQALLGGPANRIAAISI